MNLRHFHLRFLQRIKINIRDPHFRGADSRKRDFRLDIESWPGECGLFPAHVLSCSRNAVFYRMHVEFVPVVKPKTSKLPPQRPTPQRRGRVFPAGQALRPTVDIDELLTEENPVPHRRVRLAHRPVVLKPQLVEIKFRDRVAADKTIIMPSALIRAERILADHEAAPHGVNLSPRILLRTGFNVLEVRIRVRHEVGCSIHLCSQTVWQSPHPFFDFPSFLFRQLQILRIGGKSPVIEKPVVFHLVHPARAAFFRIQRLEEHPLMIADERMHERIIVVHLLHILQSLDRMCAPVAVVPEQIQLVRAVAVKIDFIEHPHKLVKSPVDVADHISRHGSYFTRCRG